MMNLVNKYCHNEECGYLYQSNPETDVYAKDHTNCPNCGNPKSVSNYPPDWHFKAIMRLWWANHHKNKED